MDFKISDSPGHPVKFDWLADGNGCQAWSIYSDRLGWWYIPHFGENVRVKKKTRHLPNVGENDTRQLSDQIALWHVTTTWQVLT